MSTTTNIAEWKDELAELLDSTDTPETGTQSSNSESASSQDEEPVYVREFYAFDPLFKGYLIVDDSSDFDTDSLITSQYPNFICESEFLAIRNEVGTFEEFDKYLSLLKLSSPEEYEDGCIEVGDFIYGIGSKDLKEVPVFQNYAIWKEAKTLELSIDKPAISQRPKRRNKI